MAKRRTSKKSKRSSRKRTSRRNNGGQSFRVGTSHVSTSLGTGRATKLDRASDLVATWKRSYAEKHGDAAGLARIAAESTARLHELIDEGVPLKQAYTETVHFFNNEDKQYLADFADDTAHKMFLLIREDGFTPTQARVAVLKGADRAVANRGRRRRRSRRARR